MLAKRPGWFRSRQFYRFRVQSYRGNLTASVDGHPMLSARDLTFLAGRFGVLVSADKGVYFDDVLVRSVRRVVYDPAEDESFPEGMTISPNRPPEWSEALDAIFFGIHEVEMTEEARTRAEEEAAGEEEEEEEPEEEAERPSRPESDEIDEDDVERWISRQKGTPVPRSLGRPPLPAP